MRQYCGGVAPILYINIWFMHYYNYQALEVYIT